MKKVCGSRKKIEEEINKIILSIIGKDKSTEKTKKNHRKEQKKPENLDNLLEKSKEKIKRFRNFVPKDSYYLFLHEKKENKEKISLKYKVKEDNVSYSVDVDYRSDNEGQETEIKVSVRDEINKEISKYSINVKENKAGQGYIILLKYENKDESLNINYKIPIKSYSEVREDKLQDFTNAVDKPLELLPHSIMGGVLGFTYLGENYMARRSDLTGRTAHMVDVHEAIHTPDEYETRVLTAWMLTRITTAYKK